LTLAQTLRDLGQKCVFLCKDLPGNVTELVRKSRFELEMFSQNLSESDELAIIKSINPRWVVADHYNLSLHWETSVQQYSRLFVIDDTMSKRHQCDVLLDQNFRTTYELAYKDLVPSSCRLLLGPKYSLLKPELTRTDEPKRFRSSHEQVLVFFGGSDITGELIKFYHAVCASTAKQQFKFVATGSHRHIDEVQKLPKHQNCEILVSPDNRVELLKESDFYFGSSGSVTWERFYLGLPGALIVMADNQFQIATELEKAGLQYYWGNVNTVSYPEVLKKIDQVLADKSKLLEISQKTKNLVDRFSSKLAEEIFLND
jgi:UDP-2,4-diacetamido-2,4,6-trideoxy-beta-L-altropyranose hydrolase